MTEASVNPEVRGRDLAAVLDRDNQNILIVATSTDRLRSTPAGWRVRGQAALPGIAAVQTLSGSTAAWTARRTRTCWTS
ncbi:hypothetical protein QJS66_19270 [Kocuria rhizophila]|nr:hypothetical protein QJS66_19270 [Kocuria rhizophila]